MSILCLRHKELCTLVASIKGYCMAIEFGRIIGPGAKNKIKWAMDEHPFAWL